jgi:hypothetical protein
MTATDQLTTIYRSRGFVLYAEALHACPELDGEPMPAEIELEGGEVRLRYRRLELRQLGCAVSFYAREDVQVSPFTIAGTWARFVAEHSLIEIADSQPKRSGLEPIGQAKLDELRELATAATAGPWAWDRDNYWLGAPDPRHPDDGGFIVIEVDRNDFDFDEPDNRYLAAVDPTTVLALLDERDACAQGWADAENARSRQLYEHHADFKDFVGTLQAQRDEIANLRARIRVEESDIGVVTRAHVETWLRANGWAPSPREGGWNSHHGNSEMWRCVEPDARCVMIYERGMLPEAINIIAYHFKRAALDVLGEIAAVSTE